MRIHALEVSTPAPHAADSAAAVMPEESSGRVIVQYGGQQFDCSVEMAKIFLKHAREVIESGDQELVPLLHKGGVELLSVSRLTPYSLIPCDET